MNGIGTGRRPARSGSARSVRHSNGPLQSEALNEVVPMPQWFPGGLAPAVGVWFLSAWRCFEQRCHAQLSRLLSVSPNYVAEMEHLPR